MAVTPTLSNMVRRWASASYKCDYIIAALRRAAIQARVFKASRSLFLACNVHLSLFLFGSSQFFEMPCQAGDQPLTRHPRRLQVCDDPQALGDISKGISALWTLVGAAK